MPPKTHTKPKAKQPVSDKKYQISVFTGGQDHIGQGDTIREALQAVKISTFKNKAIIKVKHNGIERQVMFMPQAMRKLIMPLNQQFLEKKMQILLR